MLHYPLSFRDLKHKRNVGQTFSVTFNVLRHLESQVICTTLPLPPSAEPSPTQLWKPQYQCQNKGGRSELGRAGAQRAETALHQDTCQKVALKILAIPQHPTHQTGMRIQFTALQCHLIPLVTQSSDICVADFSSVQPRADPSAALSKVLWGQQFTRLCNRAKSSTQTASATVTKLLGWALFPSVTTEVTL